MTEWSDAEISRRLALAIGWSGDQEDPDVAIFFEWREGDAECKVWFLGGWVRFDYRDPAVYAPIAERFNAFPQKMRLGPLWAAPVTPDGKRPEYPLLRWEYADTAAKAVALAVIRARGTK